MGGAQTSYAFLLCEVKLETANRESETNLLNNSKLLLLEYLTRNILLLKKGQGRGRQGSRAPPSKLL